jgi:hypothetical protein
MWHVLQLLLRVVDRGYDRCGELLEEISKAVLFGCSLASLRASLCLGSNAAIRVETSERAIAFLKDATSLFDEGLDVVDEFFLVKLVAGRAVGLFNILKSVLVA